MKLFLGVKAFDAFASFAGVESADSQFVWNPNVKGEAALKFDLPIEQMHRFRNGESQIREDVFDFTFQPRLDPGTNVGGFTHAVIVALIGLRRKFVRFREPRDILIDLDGGGADGGGQEAI